MATKPYLIFSLHNTRYAIAAKKVTEIFLLPELTSVAEAPPDIVGWLNLHSKFVPVMHLDLRFGRQFEGCHLTDSVIVVESNQLQVGIIVHQVETVDEIDDQYIKADLSYGRDRNINQAFVKSAIDLDDEIIILLNVDNLVRHPDALSALNDSENFQPKAKLSTGNFYDLCLTNAPPSTKAILNQRANRLREIADDAESLELIPIAIVGIDGNYFGIDLDVVREFIKIGQTTVVPCCPEHIIGNMNLRGEILTLVDICQPLNLTTANRSQAANAVVVEVDDIVAGIAVDEVFDVVDFRSQELKSIPVAIANTAAYLKGMADYQNQPLNLLNLQKLMTEGAMTVELMA